MKLNEVELEDILSACSFTRKEYERVRKDKAPNFKKSLEKIEKKCWKELRALRKESP
jgi:hypothetical protein